MRKTIICSVTVLVVFLIFSYRDNHNNHLEQKALEEADEVIITEPILIEKTGEKTVELYDFDHYVNECVWYRDLFGKSSYLSEHIGETLTFQVGFWKYAMSDEGEKIYVVYDEVNNVYFIGEEDSKTGRIEYKYSDFIQAGLIQIEELEPIWIEVEVLERRPLYEYSEDELADIIYTTHNITAESTTSGTIFLLDYTSFWQLDGGKAIYYYVEDEKGKITLHQILGEEDDILAIYATKDAMTLDQRIAYERVAYNPLYIIEINEQLQATLIWNCLDEHELLIEGALEYNGVLEIFRDTLYDDLWSSLSAYSSEIDTYFLGNMAGFTLYKGVENMQYFIHSEEVGCFYVIEKFGEDYYGELLLEDFHREEIKDLLSTATIVLCFEIPLVLQPKLYTPTEQEKEILELWEMEYLTNYQRLDSEQKVYLKGFYVEGGEVYIDAFIISDNGTITPVVTLVTAVNDTYSFSPVGGLYDHSVDSMYTQYYFERLKYQLFDMNSGD